MAIEKNWMEYPQVSFSQEEIWLDFAFLRVNTYNIRGTVPHITAGKGWNSSADLPGWGNSSGNTPRPSGTCLTCPWKYMSGETRASATLPLEMPLNILLASSTVQLLHGDLHIRMWWRILCYPNIPYPLCHMASYWETKLWVLFDLLPHRTRRLNSVLLPSFENNLLQEN